MADHPHLPVAMSVLQSALAEAAHGHRFVCAEIRAAVNDADAKKLRALAQQCDDMIGHEQDIAFQRLGHAVRGVASLLEQTDV